MWTAAARQAAAAARASKGLRPAARERVAIHRAADASLYHNTGPVPRPPAAPMDKIMSGLRQRYGARAPSAERVRQIMASVGAHQLHVGLLRRSLGAR
jgi:hypothetical protein